MKYLLVALMIIVSSCSLTSTEKPDELKLIENRLGAIDIRLEGLEAASEEITNEYFNLVFDYVNNLRNMILFLEKMQNQLVLTEERVKLITAESRKLAQPYVAIREELEKRVSELESKISELNN